MTASPEPPPPVDPAPRTAADRVAVILAVGISIALICFVIGVEVNAVDRAIPLSENATQVLTAAFSGIIGGLAGYLGGRADRSPPGSTGG